ncbi:unnamed protein product [Brugia timori]|uniref:EGF-like domain-containing protein n=1 Tax=Brugia timori TaxID=42155 RepID=A0A3P7T0I3_9BILA|nr:unnamed protein product [Brugia timori]
MFCVKRNTKRNLKIFEIDYINNQILYYRNVYLAAISDDEAAGFIVRKKRETEQTINKGSGGTIYLAKSDGRYLRTLIKGRLHIPTAIITLPQIGRICFADAGFDAKIECADMDGKHRNVIVKDLIYSPTSLAVDEGKDNRIYWADPKYRKVESVLPDGTKRTTVIIDNRMPWAVDVFENNLYWASKESQDLFVQDKFGRGRISVLASNIPNAHSIRIHQRFARDTSRAVSTCAEATCSHLCAELPRNTYTCLCPDESPQLDKRKINT